MPHLPVLLLCCFLALGTVAGESFGMTDAVHATFKLWNESSTATAFVVKINAEGEAKARYVIVSAAHTFEQMKGSSAKLVLRDPKPDGSYSRRDHTLAVRKDGKALWVKHKNADLALLEYTPPAEFEAFAVPFEHLAADDDLKNRVPAGTYVRLLCYPEQFEANGAGFPILRHGVIATFPIAPARLHHTFMIDFTTFAGDSGGPVFGALENAGGPGGAGKLMLLGVVVSQQWSDERVKVSDREDRVIRHPFGLGTAVNSHLLRDLIQQKQ